MLDVVILAGGLATRMRPLTDKTPKSLLEVSGRPFIDWQLQYLAQQGVCHVVLCLGHLGDRIRDHVVHGSAFGLCVEFSMDGLVSLGTGGAVKKALPLLEKDFFVLYGDSYLPVSYAEIESSFHSGIDPALMTIFRNDNRLDKSNVVFSKGRVIHYDKRLYLPEMNYIDYGLSILSKDVFSSVPEGGFDLGDLYSQLAQQGRLAGYEVHERFYEVGSPAGLAETVAYFNCLSKGLIQRP